MDRSSASAASARQRLTALGSVGDGNWVIEPLTSGASARRVERLRRGDHAVVRKWAPPHEIAALRAAQAVLPEASAVPTLIEVGQDQDGPWYTTPYYPGAPTDTLTDEAIVSLARLHAHFRGAQSSHPDVPAVTTHWWRELCASWVLPGIERHGPRHGRDVEQRAISLLDALVVDLRIPDALARITPTLLHGDVHSGNVISDGETTHLIDWGSARFGTPMLDVVNMVDPESSLFDTYLGAHAAQGVALSDWEIRSGLEWAALQIPIQYLPWQLEHSKTSQVMQALDSAEAALESTAPA